MPAWSVARTSKVWLPSASAGESVSGLEQGVQEPPSIRHSKLEPVSVELKEKLGVVLFEGSLGCAVIDVSGAVLSTRRFATVAEGAEFPTRSAATTRRS